VKRIAAAAWVGVCLVGLCAWAGPRLSVDQAVFDFGTVTEGVSVVHTFVLRNVGDAPLTILSVRATCGCTTTALTRNQLPPGESVDLRAVLSTTGYRGRITKSINVSSTDLQQPQVSLRMTGTVNPKQPYHLPLEDLHRQIMLLIDVRPIDEFAAGHLIGAVHLPLDDLPARALTVPRGLFTVVYDQDGTRVEEAVSRLRASGVGDAWGLRGGIDAWRSLASDRYEVAGAPTAEAFQEDISVSGPTTATESLITPHNLRRWFYVLVDVRSAAAFASEHLAGAISVPSERAGSASTWIPNDVKVIFYDQDGSTTDAIAQRFIGAGFTQAMSLMGGLDGWKRVYGELFLAATGE